MNLDTFYHISSFLDSASYLSLRLTCKELYSFLKEKEVKITDILKNKYIPLYSRVSLREIEYYRKEEVYGFLYFYVMRYGSEDIILNYRCYGSFFQDLLKYLLSSCSSKELKFIINKIPDSMKSLIFYNCLSYGRYSTYRYLVTSHYYQPNIEYIITVIESNIKSNPFSILKFILDKSKVSRGISVYTTILQCKMINIYPELIFFFKDNKKELEYKGLKILDLSKKEILIHFIDKDNLSFIKKFFKKDYHKDKKGKICLPPSYMIKDNSCKKYLQTRFGY